METAELLKLIMKSFYSVIYLGAVPLLLRDEQFVGWMQGIHTVITSSVPPVPPVLVTCELQRTVASIAPGRGLA